MCIVPKCESTPLKRVNLFYNNNNMMMILKSSGGVGLNGDFASEQNSSGDLERKAEVTTDESR